MSRAILFNHPGREHVPERGQRFFLWNTDLHRRKFLITPARLATRAGAGWAADQGWREVGLWGEWEPPSDCGTFPTSVGVSLLPRAWHRPMLGGGSMPPGAQNTDPWVFGPVMRYSNCRQARYGLLRSLDPGDVIFFGSVMKRSEDGSESQRFNFFLDTVFVVGSARPYDPSSPGGLPVDQVFIDHVLACLCAGGSCRGYALYTGSMLANTQSSDIFSYVPCKLTAGDHASARFARPRIDHLLGKPFPNPQIGIVELSINPVRAWEAVVDKCRSKGLELAVEVETPAKATGKPPLPAPRPGKPGPRGC